jgi:hypothetical protein
VAEHFTAAGLPKLSFSAEEAFAAAAAYGNGQAPYRCLACGQFHLGNPRGLDKSKKGQP